MRLHHLALLLLLATPSWSQAIPRALQGSWRVAAVVPTHTGCWAGDSASQMLNTTLTYSAGELAWNGHTFPITETFTRTLTPQTFRQESAQTGSAIELAALGIHAPRATEYNLQHDDVDITDVTTEAPGDTVLLAAPNRIIISVCGTWFEATRASGSRAPAPKQAAAQHRPLQRTAQTPNPEPTRKSGL